MLALSLCIIVTSGGCRKAEVMASSPVNAPRLVAPLNRTSLFTSKPQFRVELAADSDGAEIEVCSDPACAVIVGRLSTEKADEQRQQSKTSGLVVTTTRPSTTDLPTRKPLYWRARGTRGRSAKKGDAASPIWEFTIRPNPPGVTAAARLAKNDAELLAQAKKLRLFEIDDHGLPLLLGDVNGDGYGDVALTDNRSAAIFLGGRDGLSEVPVLKNLSSSRSTAEAVLGYEGGRIQGQGIDINGDGFMDYVGIDEREQAVRIHYGGSKGLRPTPDVVLSPPSEAKVNGFDSRFGNSVDYGDVNGDGYADVVVADHYANRVFVFFGGKAPERNSPLVITSPSQLTKEMRGELHFGLGVSVNDANDDGVDDITVSSACYPTNPFIPGSDLAPSTCRYLGSRSHIAIDNPIVLPQQ